MIALRKTKHDWSAADAMTDEEIRAAALSDPDAQPLTEEQLRHFKPQPRVKVLRRVLGLSQGEFSEQFRIPIGTLRDWEQGRKEPDAAARAYLVVIARNPDAVRKALSSASMRARSHSGSARNWRGAGTSSPLFSRKRSAAVPSRSR